MIESGSSASVHLVGVVGQHGRAGGEADPPAVGAGRTARGTCARVASSTWANRSLLSTSVMAGEFSVRNTSAGDAEPSWTSWLASSKSSPLRIFTLMPVALVKPGTISWSSSSCWALYSVSVGLSPHRRCRASPPQAAVAITRTAVATTAVSRAVLRMPVPFSR